MFPIVYAGRSCDATLGARVGDPWYISVAWVPDPCTKDYVPVAAKKSIDPATRSAQNLIDVSHAHRREVFDETGIRAPKLREHLGAILCEDVVVRFFDGQIVQFVRISL